MFATSMISREVGKELTEVAQEAARLTEWLGALDRDTLDEMTLEGWVATHVCGRRPRGSISGSNG